MRQRHSELLTGKKHSEETKKKMSQTRKLRGKTPEAKESQAEAMRLWHASRTPEQKAKRSAKLSSALKGQKRTPEQRERNAVAQRGKTLSEDHKVKVSEGLKAAYAEGRRESYLPVFKGPHTEESRQKISDSLKGREAWNAGIETGPRPLEVREKISASLTGQPHPVSPGKMDAWKKAISEGKRGHVQSEETRLKRGDSLRRAYAEGRHQVPEKSGYGRGSHFDTPFQGRKWFRSSSEVQRARELDEEGLVWFYEIRCFPVTVGGRNSTYRPDFWVFPGISRDLMGDDASDFLDTHLDSLILEDVKGWWGPKHKTYAKIQAFTEQYPEFDFRIVVRGGIPL